MPVKLKLKSIDYEGSVGREWSFNISAGNESIDFDTILIPGGSNMQDKIIMVSEAGTNEMMSISLNVDATERDKVYPDEGNGSGKFDVNMANAGTEQMFSIDVTVTENRGGQSRMPATANLKLNFIAIVEDESTDCDGNAMLAVVINVQNTLPASFIQQFQGLDEITFGLTVISDSDDNSKWLKLETCIYKSGSEYKIKPKLAESEIRWGSNTNNIINAPEPNSSNVDFLILNIMRYLDIKNGTYPDADWLPIQANLSINTAHEAVHIENFKECISLAWEEIRTMINAKTFSGTNLEEVGQMNKQFIDDLKNSWAERIAELYISKGYNSETKADAAGIAEAKRILEELKKIKQ